MANLHKYIIIGTDELHNSTITTEFNYPEDRRSYSFILSRIAIDKSNLSDDKKKQLCELTNLLEYSDMKFDLYKNIYLVDADMKPIVQMENYFWVECLELGYTEQHLYVRYDPDYLKTIIDAKDRSNQSIFSWISSFFIF